MVRSNRSVEKIETIGKMGTKHALEMVPPENQGLEKWLEDYREENGMDAKELLANADSGMSKYDSAMQAFTRALQFASWNHNQNLIHPSIHRL